MKGKLPLGLLIFLIAALTFVNLSETVRSVDTNALDPFSARTMQALKLFFASSATALAVGYLRNILGFAENWFRAKYGHKEIDYELEKLGETWAKYEAGVLAISLWLPPPVAATLTFILDLVTSAIRKLRSSS